MIGARLAYGGSLAASDAEAAKWRRRSVPAPARRFREADRPLSATPPRPDPELLRGAAGTGARLHHGGGGCGTDTVELGGRRTRAAALAADQHLPAMDRHLLGGDAVLGAAQMPIHCR